MNEETPNRRDADAPVPRFLWLILALALVAGIGVLVSPTRSGQVSVVDTPVEFADRLAGAQLFARAGCADCHDPTGVNTALGPSLSGMAARARDRIAQPDYSGEAGTAIAYVEEAILDHCADRLPGYDCEQVPEVGLLLSLAEVAQLATYLLDLPDEAAP